MPAPSYDRFLRPALLLLAVYLFLRYGLPLALPFLAGLLLALAAEPVVRFLCRRLSWKRTAAAFCGVSLTLLLLTTLGLLLFSGAFQGLRWLASVAPDLESAARHGLTSLQDWLISLALAAPDGIRNLLTKLILSIFDNGSALFSQAASVLPGIAAGLFSRITGGFLGIGTAIFSAYLISARLPRMRLWFQQRLSGSRFSRILPALRQLRSAAGGWLNAQARLMGLTFCVLLAGFLLLGVRYAPLWAVLIAFVDAVPMLGTGLVLVPWSVICFLQDDPLRAFGLLGIFALATLIRSALEPRLVGQQLGLDPLVTLISLYLGYQLLGLPGLLTAPLLAATAIRFLNMSMPKEEE